MSGQATEALKVYERMLRAGADPTATTYTALISAYGKNGQLDRALQIFEDMVGISYLNNAQYHLSKEVNAASPDALTLSSAAHRNCMHAWCVVDQGKHLHLSLIKTVCSSTML